MLRSHFFYLIDPQTQQNDVANLNENDYHLD